MGCLLNGATHIRPSGRGNYNQKKGAEVRRRGVKLDTSARGFV
jgi:hypothetical protein